MGEANEGSINLVLVELRNINQTQVKMNDSINEVHGEIYSLKIKNDQRKN